MKHVREDLPDVQMRRPEVSAGLAAILDRMTDKHLEHRYPDAHTLEVDLEDALAAEAARSGRSTGEATAVIATLPERTKRRLPLRMRRRFPLFAVIARAAARRAAVAVLAGPGPRAHRARHRPGQGQGAAGHQGRLRQAHLGAGLRPARRRRRARRRGAASPSTRTRARRGRPRATAAPRWPARTASASTSTPRRASPPRSIEIDTPKPGWQAEIHVAPDGDAPNGAPGEGGDWQEVGGGKVKHKRQRFTLRTGGKAYRYYLVWITKLPAGRRARRDHRRLAVPQQRPSS